MNSRTLSMKIEDYHIKPFLRKLIIRFFVDNWLILGESPKICSGSGLYRSAYHPNFNKSAVFFIEKEKIEKIVRVTRHKNCSSKVLWDKRASFKMSNVQIGSAAVSHVGAAAVLAHEARNSRSDLDANLLKWKGLWWTLDDEGQK